MTTLEVLYDQSVSYHDFKIVIYQVYKNNQISKYDLLLLTKLKSLLFYDDVNDFVSFISLFAKYMKKKYTEFTLFGKNIFEYIYDHNCIHICCHLLYDRTFLIEFFNLKDTIFIQKVLEQMLYQFDDLEIRNLIAYIFIKFLDLDTDKCNAFINKFINTSDSILFRLGYRINFVDNYLEFIKMF